MNKTLFVNQDRLEAICKKYSTLFDLYGEAEIRATAQAVDQAFG